MPASARLISPRARARPNPFTVIFYGARIFWCKGAQSSETLRECEMAETPNVGNGAQADENPRKNSLLN
jgi:hypothetical protein